MMGFAAVKWCRCMEFWLLFAIFVHLYLFAIEHWAIFYLHRPMRFFGDTIYFAAEEMIT